MQTTFLRFASLVLIGISVTSINGVLEVVNAPVSFSKFSQGWVSFWTPAKKVDANGSVRIENGKQKVLISIQNNGYSPRMITVKKGIPVELTLKSTNVYSCALDFHLKAFNVRQFLQATDSKTVVFTPNQAGTFPFTCGMGMYTGILKVE